MPAALCRPYSSPFGSPLGCPQRRCSKTKRPAGGTMNRRTIAMMAGCILAAGLTLPAAAQDYPNQTIKMISSFGAGGGSDIIGRIIAQRMQEKLGQPVVVENRPGAGGLLGNEAVANSPKDGYTIGVQTAGQIITPVMTKVVRFQAVDSFDWIGQI